MISVMTTSKRLAVCAAVVTQTVMANAISSVLVVFMFSKIEKPG
jgi:hypothetical protein